MVQTAEDLNPRSHPQPGFLSPVFLKKWENARKNSSLKSTELEMTKSCHMRHNCDWQHQLSELGLQITFHTALQTVITNRLEVGHPWWHKGYHLFRCMTWVLKQVRLPWGFQYMLEGFLCSFKVLHIPETRKLWFQSFLSRGEAHDRQSSVGYCQTFAHQWFLSILEEASNFSKDGYLLP